ncbi:unnamed protein product [Prorocentrum cordatum]|uniref:Uncharacterized protein n=1 Tax=Prorocentrum cordatum TaxID=2364126 RepID=A0ABN9W6N1_9DINO|nr:unnamed protein product [Polarella glacialis]
MPPPTTDCDAILWLFTLAGAVEWWVAAYGSGNAELRDLTWLSVALGLWLVPTVLMDSTYLRRRSRRTAHPSELLARRPRSGGGRSGGS